MPRIAAETRPDVVVPVPLGVSAAGTGLLTAAGLVAVVSARIPGQSPLPVNPVEVAPVVLAAGVGVLLLLVGRPRAGRTALSPTNGWALVGGGLVAGSTLAILLHGHLRGPFCVAAGAALGALCCAVATPHETRARHSLRAAASVVALGTAYAVASGRLLPRQPDDDALSWVLLGAMVVSAVASFVLILTRPRARGTAVAATSLPVLVLVMLVSTQHHAARINYVGTIDGECCVTTTVGVAYPVGYVRIVLACLAVFAVLWVWTAVRRQRPSYLTLVVVTIVAITAAAFPAVGFEASTASALSLLGLGATLVVGAAVARVVHGTLS